MFQNIFPNPHEKGGLITSKMLKQNIVIIKWKRLTVVVLVNGKEGDGKEKRKGILRHGCVVCRFVQIGEFMTFKRPQEPI